MYNNSVIPQAKDEVSVSPYMPRSELNNYRGERVLYSEYKHSLQQLRSFLWRIWIILLF